MSFERALISQTGSYVVSSRLKNAIENEIAKGCSSDISIQPVSLEPNFDPIWAIPNVRRPIQTDYSFENPIDLDNLVRRQIWISPEQEFDWNNSELFIKQIQTILHPLGFEVAGNSDMIMMSFTCHKIDFPVINAAFQGVFESCELSKIDNNPFSGLKEESWNNTCFRDYFPHPPYYNLLTRPSEIKTSPLRPLLIALSNVNAPAVGFYQALFQPVSPERNWHRNVEILLDLEYNLKLQSGFHLPQRYSQQAPSGDLRHMAMDLENKAHNDKPFFTLAIRVGIVGGGDNSESTLSPISTFTSLFQHGGRPLSYITQERYKSILNPGQIGDMFKLGIVHRPGFLVNSWELTGPVHIPPMVENSQRKVSIQILETLTITNPELLSGTWIGTCDYAGKSQKACIPQTIREKGVHLIGKSGMGKSSTEEHMILDDIENGDGVAVLDPHNDLIERLLRLIPEQHVERVIYFDPGDPDWIPCFNPLIKIIGQDVGRATNDIVAAIESFVSRGGWGDRLENILRNIIYALLELSNGTFLNVSNLLRNKSKDNESIRRQIIASTDNETVRQFWLHDYQKYSKAEMSPPINKLSKLLVSGTPSLMLSQPENRFNIRKIMDEGMIFLINLSNVDVIIKHVLGCFILSLFHLNALTRSSIAPHERRQFHIHCDEAHQFVTDSIENLIAETRKYGVSLNLANQYLSQFGKRKIDALSSIGTSIIFNVNKDDSQFLIKTLQNKVKNEDVVSLKEYEAIARIGTDIVKIKTRPPRNLPVKNFRDQIIEESRRKYYKPVSEIKSWLKKQGGKLYPSVPPLVFTPERLSDGSIKEFVYDEL